MVGMALRARPNPDRTFLVSDAMPTVGGPDCFDLYGQSVHLDGRRLVNSEGSLAGAHTTMAESVARLHHKVGVAAEDALKMAISIPAACMGLDLDRIVGKPIDDLITLDPDLNFRGFLSKMVDQKAA